MLAYVFWHWPRPEVEASDYGARLERFHRELAASETAGFRGSRVFAVSSVPGVPEAPGLLEDWYFVDDFAALGVMNDAAVAARMRSSHDAAASLVAGGTAGIYKLCSPRQETARAAAWFGKPAGTTYATFFGAMPAGVELWQRQMVLGPSPEFCALAPAAEDLVSLPGGARPVRMLFESSRGR